MEFKFIDPATDFSDGIGVIKVYHQDFLVRGKELLNLVEEIGVQGMNEVLANRCIDMHCHYFHANRLHHLDEEQGLFPMLENRSQLFNGMIDLLIQDHEEIEALWEPLSLLLGKPGQLTEVVQLKELSAAFEKSQREHLTREDEDFLPKIEETLSLEQRRQVGQVMIKLRKPAHLISP
jgi:hemerythrin-like domain-containing protein